MSFDKKKAIEEGPYAILGLDQSAIEKMDAQTSHDAIRDAYRARQREWHPDIPANKDKFTPEESHDRLTMLVDAYNYLTDSRENLSSKNPFHGFETSHTTADDSEDFESYGHESTGDIVTIHNFRNFYDPGNIGWERFINIANADCENQTRYDMDNDQFGVGSIYKRLRSLDPNCQNPIVWSEEWGAYYNARPSRELVLDCFKVLTDPIFRAPTADPDDSTYNQFWFQYLQKREDEYADVPLPGGRYLNGHLWPWSSRAVMAKITAGYDLNYAAITWDDDPFSAALYDFGKGVVEMYRISNLDSRNPEVCASAVAALVSASDILQHFNLMWSGGRWAPEGHDNAQARYAGLLADFCKKYKREIEGAMILIDPEFEPASIFRNATRPLGQNPGALASPPTPRLEKPKQ